ncbi:MAG: dienelactone hydrolase family protein [Candidatus Eiseniibacteriota bacterium]
MGKTIKLTTGDGKTISAYVAEPSGKPKGGLVVIQEIFGVNRHIRNVTDGFAASGYRAVAPAMFDRVKPGVELGYTGDDLAHGRELRSKLSWDDVMADLKAGVEEAKKAGKIGVVGYCFGGTVAWLAATRLGIPSVGYYGGGIAGFANEQPKAPVMLHFGEKDAHIPLTDVEKVRAAHPKVPIHVYKAGHGFSCDERADFDKASHEAALKRTLAFFAEYVG